MFKYLLITFCTLFLISCSTDTFEEDLVESNENLFPTSYFSNRYFFDDFDNLYQFDSIQIIYDEENRPIEKKVKYLLYSLRDQKVNYINDSEYEIIENGQLIETGNYQLKLYYKHKIIQKIWSEKNGIVTKYDYQPIDGDTVLTSVQEFKDNRLVANETYTWDRNNKYPHVTNLDSIVRTDIIDDDNLIRTVTKFDYDDYQNPFIRLGIFDDINYRHLSFNNFIKKSIRITNKDNVQMFKNVFNCEFKYKNGKVDLTK
ncbi:hypothetical protein [Empedobacter sp. GD03865]|uniref:hypothetical protein n=1 Tax=Empedobacter sp. GD03865 TaxID=2975392 RepID=UPI00244773B2|nr:hypothetical protein [Empedobacter sp. GD03865]MDH0659638.1 hypothetical protein [Empedobacter sp. GD03865]